MSCMYLLASIRTTAPAPRPTSRFDGSVQDLVESEVNWEKFWSGVDCLVGYFTWPSTTCPPWRPLYVRVLIMALIVAAP